MTPAAAALEAARAAGVRVMLAGTDLRLEAAREPSPDLLAALREHKVAIVGLLAEAQAPLRALAPPESVRPAPGTARRPRGTMAEWPDREDLEGWRARLREASARGKSMTEKRFIVGAWLGLWGGRLDGYGLPVLPEDLPECGATTALRSACGHYWRVTGDRATDPKRPPPGGVAPPDSAPNRGDPP